MSSGASSSSAEPSAAARTSALLRNLPRHRAAPNVAIITGSKPVQRTQSTMRAYRATHEFTQPPATQIVRTETQNILLRAFHARAEKRAGKRGSDSSRQLVEPAAKRARGAEGVAPSDAGPSERAAGDPSEGGV